MKHSEFQKTFTVEVLCQVVSSDLVPVDGYGEEYGKGWEQNLEWCKRRRSFAWMKKYPFKWRAPRFNDDLIRRGRLPRDVRWLLHDLAYGDAKHLTNYITRAQIALMQKGAR